MGFRAHARTKHRCLIAVKVGCQPTYGIFVSV